MPGASARARASEEGELVAGEREDGVHRGFGEEDIAIEDDGLIVGGPELGGGEKLIRIGEAITSVHRLVTHRAGDFVARVERDDEDGRVLRALAHETDGAIDEAFASAITAVEFDEMFREAEIIIPSLAATSAQEDDAFAAAHEIASLAERQGRDAHATIGRVQIGRAHV